MTNELKSLYWIEELLPHDAIPKSMQGGVGYFLNEKLVLILVESSLTREHKGIEYPFHLWKGCFFPIEKIKQNAVIARFPILENHPASSKWLYLPEETEDFEDHVKNLLREIKKGNPLFGMIPKIAAPKKRAVTAEDEDEVVDLSKPQSFRDKPATKAEKRAAQIKTEPDKPVKKSLLDKKIKANKKPENRLILDMLKRKSK